LRDPLTNLPLARGEAVRLVRYLPSASLADLVPPPRPALSAVVAVAAPAEVPPLDVSALVAAARAGLSAIPSTVLDGRDGRLPATLPNLTAALRDGAPILIPACHGALIGSEPYLWLEQDAPGPYHPIAGTAFVAALAQLERKPLLVVLAACQGAGTSYEVLRAMGPQLARVGVGAVLAMREQIPQVTVDTLLPPLFAELRRDGALDRALAAAQRYDGHRERQWHCEWRGGWGEPGDDSGLLHGRRFAQACQRPACVGGALPRPRGRNMRPPAPLWAGAA